MKNGQYYKYVCNRPMGGYEDNLWLLVSIHEHVCMFKHISGTTSKFGCFDGIYPFTERMIEESFIMVSDLFKPIKHIKEHRLC